MLQFVPFQFSSARPAAQMSLAETAAIEPRLSVAIGSGSGLLTTLQFVPFHCSISAWGQHLLLGFSIPTAQTSLLATAPTPSRSARPLRVAVGMALQLVPPKCTANGVSALVSSTPAINAVLYNPLETDRAANWLGGHIIFGKVRWIRALPPIVPIRHAQFSAATGR
jgi:hypothetical protein